MKKLLELIGNAITDYIIRKKYGKLIFEILFEKGKIVHFEETKKKSYDEKQFKIDENEKDT
ncbi:MAG: hypothetical protein H8D45_02935 [Bacteroidetes bacterium]|nr:hypothetical protein [Bacteroidota bacterium]